jgi:hypothetical protein
MKILREMDDETLTTIIQLALEEVEASLLDVSKSSEEKAKLRSYREALLGDMPGPQLRHTARDDRVPLTSTASSVRATQLESDYEGQVESLREMERNRRTRKNWEASRSEDELVESLREMQKSKRDREASGSGRMVNASTTRVESTRRVYAREPVRSSQRTPTSKDSFILCFSKQTNVNLNLTSSLAKTILEKH